MTRASPMPLRSDAKPFPRGFFGRLSSSQAWTRRWPILLLLLLLLSLLSILLLLLFLLSLLGILLLLLLLLSFLLSFLVAAHGSAGALLQTTILFWTLGSFNSGQFWRPAPRAVAPHNMRHALKLHVAMNSGTKSVWGGSVVSTICSS